MNSSRFPAILILCMLITHTIFAQHAGFSHATIFSAGKNNLQLQQAVKVLQLVIEERSTLLLPVTHDEAFKGKPVIVVGIEKQTSAFPENYRKALSNLSPTGKDGYKIAFLRDKQTILVIGHDERGALYGVGYLLRKMELRTGQIFVPEDLSISSTPDYPIRGHQLGYRPKTNAYDAWTVTQFDHYIRDLAIFGANSIEIMPPRTDDDLTSVHMKLPPIKMMTEQSRICKKYGLDVWMWYPNLGSDYTSPDSIQKELAEYDKVFSVLPKLDALFVPGGDPGHLEPDVLFKWLKKVAVVLHKHHPNAKIWISPQSFTQKELDVFYKEVNQGYAWFGGVVYGPWIRESIQEVRRLVNKGIPIRLYPDITHIFSSQYPIPELDIAHAITLGREGYNPRPYDEKHIHNLFAKYAQGSISYSEGINDDVNKFVWSGQDWNPKTPVIETLRDYARLFIGPDYAETVAQGIIALENNMKGPLLVNSKVAGTLQQWQDMERDAPGNILSNFRFQMSLLMAYYNAYIQRRLFYEAELEKQARDALMAADKTGSIKAIKIARDILEQAVNNPVQPQLRQRCFALADSVFRSIGSQLTIKKHGAKDGRGNFIDNIDLPLNDAGWLLSQFLQIEKMQDEKTRLQAIDKMLNRTNPGPGGFYDNLGSPDSRNRIIRQKTWAEDPGGLVSPLIDFGTALKGEAWVDILPAGFKGEPILQAWMIQVTTLYNTPLMLKYDHLDPQSSYLIRVAYTGRFHSNLKLVADGKYLIHDFIETGIKPFYEFTVPAGAVADGTVKFNWTCDKGERGVQVAEIWLIKKQ